MEKIKILYCIVLYNNNKNHTTGETSCADISGASEFMSTYSIVEINMYDNKEAC